MTKAIFFDMDGTIFNTTSVLGIALDRTFDVLRAGKLWSGATPIETYYEIMGVPLPVVWQKLCPQFDEPLRIRCNELFHTHLITSIQQGEGRIYDGVQDVLQTLYEKYPLFITSNGEVAYLQAIVDAFELRPYFTGIYSIQQIDSLDKAKLVELAKAEHKVTEGFVVGDRLSDINAAKANQLQAIGVDFDFAQQEELVQADYVVTSLYDIINVIK